MTVTEHTLVADIAATVPSSVRVFQRYGVDFCCGGQTPLGAACEERGLSFVEVAEAIEKSVEGPDTTDRDWAAVPLSYLTAHITVTYHDALHEELPRLEAMAVRVAHVHGPKAPRLLGRIETTLRELSADLTAHMGKEEAVLFPAIAELERGGTPRIPLSAAIRAMEGEHDRAGGLLSELRMLTGGFVPPAWACATVRALYAGLGELETAMHVHVHLENNILFPRATALALSREEMAGGRR